MSTLVKNRPLHLMHADMGLRNDGRWLPSNGALPLRVGSVRRVAVRLSDGGLALMCPRRCQAPLAHRALWFLARERLQWPSNFSGGLDLLRRQVNAASFGVGVSCGCGSKSAPWSCTGVADILVLTAGERCILAASGVMGGGGDKMRNLSSSSMARWLTPGSCSSTRGSLSPSMLASSPAIPPSSSITSGPVPSRCTGAFGFGLMSSPGIESGSP